MAMTAKSSCLVTLVALVASLALAEGIAYWWMNPPPVGLGLPKLVYHSRDMSAQLKSDPPNKGDLRIVDEEGAIVTALPEVLSSTLAVLACSTGTVSKIEQVNGVVIHLAFFEWDSADSISVLEAFRHLPEECMGSIGMELVAKLPPKFHTVGKERLLFDHTIFKDPVGRTIHAFKGTWVSGASKLIGSQLRGGADQWREIRFKAGLNRFKPAYAAVAQGAVRGVSDPQLAWLAYERAMLNDLAIQ
jgi:hypothetical protein